MSEKDPQTSQPNEEPERYNLDVTNVPLGDLLNLDFSSVEGAALKDVIAKVAADQDEPQQYAAFGSAP